MIVTLPLERCALCLACDTVWDIRASHVCPACASHQLHLLARWLTRAALPWRSEEGGGERWKRIVWGTQ